MRGRVDGQGSLFHIFDVESRIRADHPLRAVKTRVDRLLAALQPRFAAAYSHTGRPSIPPERLLKALLLMALYSVRSECQLVERIDTDLLFRWFLDMDPSEEVFDATAFAHNRPRLEEHGLTRAFFDAVLAEALTAGLCSEHFSVDGTMIESYGSMKSVRPIESSAAVSAVSASEGNSFKPRNAEVDFRGQKRTNETHRSRTDPEARLYRKSGGEGTKLSHLAHTLGENRHGLIVGITVTEANGTAERTAALEMLDQVARTHGWRPTTLGADKGYDSGAFCRALEARGIEPHVAMMTVAPRDPRRARTYQRPDVEARRRMWTRLASIGYRLSQKCRKKVEEGYGWFKGVALLGRSRVVGRWKMKQLFELGAAAYNLVRYRKLLPVA
jgi:transposase